MIVTNSQFTIAEYVKQMQRGDIVVNKDYQRSSAVWPPAARSYLIDTILHGYPMPKLSLYQKTDLKSRTTIKEIVDGQQRSEAIRDFLENKLRISGHSDYRNKTFEQLDPADQQRCLAYSLSVDVFAAASDEEIREIFRRINSYNIPLNGAERRHATFQGEFKWFIVKLCEDYSQSLKDMRVFSEQQLARMQDAALFTEVCRTLAHGIEHASEPKLSALYEEFDDQFDVRPELTAAVNSAMALLIGCRPLHGSALYKPYNVYSLMTAIGHISQRFTPLQSVFKVERRSKVKARQAINGLSRLARALEDDERKGRYASFVEACRQKTNRIDTRTTRFRHFCEALMRG